MMTLARTFLKYSLYLLMLFSLSGCAHLFMTKTPEENLLDLENGTVAAVISGCGIRSKQVNLFRADAIKYTSCTLMWRSQEGNSATLDGYPSIDFVKPGIYEFAGFYGTVYDYATTTRVSYIEKDTSSLFKSFSVKGGGVIYIGDFIIDNTGSKRLVHSIQFRYSDYRKSGSFGKKLAKYDVLLDKLENRLIDFKPEVKAARDLFPVLETQ